MLGRVETNWQPATLSIIHVVVASVSVLLLVVCWHGNATNVSIAETEIACIERCSSASSLDFLLRLKLVEVVTREG